MKIIFLGTGTSVGIPMIGCDCPVCTSADPHNNRRRSSLYVEAAGTHIVIDTAPDFREQVLQHKIPRVDAVLFTHAHADHVLGFDDIRRFNTIQGSVIPAYGSPETIADVRRIFDYVQTTGTPGVFRPRIDFISVTDPFDVEKIHVRPLHIDHGDKPTLGYLLEAEQKRVAYVPDCLEIPNDTMSELRDLDIMILDALRHRPHITHLTLEDSLVWLAKIRAKQSYIIHMCHDLDHATTAAALPDTVDVSYDGLQLTL